MSVLKCQVTIPDDSAIVADAVVNSFHFGTASPAVDLTAAAAIISSVADMYATINSPGLSSLVSFMSGELNPNNALFRVYRLNDPVPRVPLVETTVNLGNASTSGALPREVAAVGSYQAVKQSGVPQARRRGRFYLGPLAQNAATAPSGGTSRPATNFLDALRGGMMALKADSDAALDWTWVVFSTVLGLNDTAAVDNGWVDNAWDTQRRRGLAPTVRSLWS